MAAQEHLQPKQFKMPLDVYASQQKRVHDPAAMPLDIWRSKSGSYHSAKLREKLVNDPRSGAHEL